MKYPINFYASTYNNEFDEDGAAKHKDVADLGSTCIWQDLTEVLKDHKGLINGCRLPLNMDLCTPLHDAAKGGATREVFGELVKLCASKTLKDAEGKTAYDIAKSVGLRYFQTHWSSQRNFRQGNRNSENGKWSFAGLIFWLSRTDKSCHKSHSYMSLGISGIRS